MAESFSKASSLVLWISTDAHLYDDPDDASIPPFLLDSRFDSDKSEALKRLLVLIAQGADVSHFFPQVMKNVASPSLEVKKLFYLQLPLTMDAKRVRHEYKAKKISEEKYVNAMKGEISRVVKPLRRSLTLRNCN